jgi:CDP-paratose 2-epimerase
MKVVVTGGCGFLGSHVCEYYTKSRDEVVAFDNLTKHELRRTGYDADLAREHMVAFLKNINVPLFNGDVRKSDEIARAANGCDFIIHTAAQPAMTISIEMPDLDFSTNVQGTFNVLEAARKNDAAVVFCSTIHVYGSRINDSLREASTRYTRDPSAISEEHPVMQGKLTPLHASKMSAELYVKTYMDTYGLKAGVFRLTGIYGPRQFGGEDHGWVANFTIRALLDRPITIFGNGKQVRDILYVQDAAAAFNRFYEAPSSGGIFNIGGGPECAISLLECIKLIEDVTGHKATVNYGDERLGDLRYFVCDISKARKELNWFPKVHPREGIKNLASWAMENKDVFMKT